MFLEKHFQEYASNGNAQVVKRRGKARRLGGWEAGKREGEKVRRLGG